MASVWVSGAPAPSEPSCPQAPFPAPPMMPIRHAYGLGGGGLSTASLCPSGPTLATQTLATQETQSCLPAFAPAPPALGSVLPQIFVYTPGPFWALRSQLPWPSRHTLALEATSPTHPLSHHNVCFLSRQSMPSPIMWGGGSGEGGGGVCFLAHNLPPGL